MPEVDLFLTVRYDVTKDTFEIESNIKPDKRAEVITEFIRCQIGAGRDETPREERDVYTIKLGLALVDDTFYVEHDCGNKGLRDGILMRVMRDL
jgi:hypothetical protein